MDVAVPWPSGWGESGIIGGPACAVPVPLSGRPPLRPHVRATGHEATLPCPGPAHNARNVRSRGGLGWTWRVLILMPAQGSG